METKKQIYILYIVIVVFAFVLYGNTLKNKYSLDDTLVAFYDKDVKEGISSIPKFFKSRYGVSGKVKYAYRPIVKATYAIEYEFFGVEPSVSHFFNIIFYALSLIILFKTLLLLFINYKSRVVLSLIIVLFFAAHPLHTEVVASLKNRDALLSFLGGVLGLYFILKLAHSNNYLYLFFAILSYVFANLSKPDAMIFAAIYPLSLFVFTSYSRKKILFILIGFLLLLYIVRYIPNLYLPENFRPKYFFENPLYIHKSLLIRMQAAFNTSVFYIKMMFYPHPLVFYYGYNMVPVYGFTILSVLSGVFHFTLLGYSIYIIKKKKVLAFGILFYLIAISMFLNFLIPAVGIVAERFSYSAVLGFSIVIVFLLFYFFKKDLHNNNSIKQIAFSKIGVVITIILIVFSVKTISRNNDWYDDLSLYTADIKYLNNSAKANQIYAKKLLFELNKNFNKYKSIDEVKNIENHFLRAIELDTSFISPLVHLGYINTVIYNKPEKGLEYLLKYENKENDNSKVSSLIAVSYEKMKNYSKATAYYYKTYKLDSNYIPALEKIANLNFNNGNLDSAIYLNERIMKLQPNSPKPYENIAKFYYVLKDTVKMKYYINMRNEKNSFIK